jgi:hypothetical protein
MLPRMSDKKKRSKKPFLLARRKKTISDNLYPAYDGLTLPDCHHLDLDENGTCRSCGRFNLCDHLKIRLVSDVR